MAVYVVIGGNRGLGLETVTQLLSSDSKATVVATARAPEQAEDLQKLVKQYDGRLKTFKLDASSDASIKVILLGHAEVTHALTKASFVALSPSRRNALLLGTSLFPRLLVAGALSSNSFTISLVCRRLQTPSATNYQTGLTC